MRQCLIEFYSVAWSWIKPDRNRAINFIKGLHYIEMKYKEVYNNDFGFGSPYPTSKFIDKLKATDEELAQELTKWVANKGGNYYIGRNDE